MLIRGWSNGIMAIWPRAISLTRSERQHPNSVSNLSARWFRSRSGGKIDFATDRDCNPTRPVPHRPSAAINYVSRHAEARMPKCGTFCDLVERTAARERLPRLELWQDAAKALIDGNLSAVNPLDCLSLRTTPQMNWGRGWLRHFLAAVQRGSDPSSFKHILKLITVSKTEFKKWRRKTSSGHRGPEAGTTGY